MLINKRLVRSDKKQKYKPAPISLRRSSAFTIVELLVVIVVIGILAAISFVSYSGITERAIAARIKSDLSTNTKLLELYKIEHDEYPATLDTNTDCPATPEPDPQYCLTTSNEDDTLVYVGGGDDYTLTITNEVSDISYEIVPGGQPVQVNGGNTVGATFVDAWGGVNDDEAYSMIKTSDDGFVIAGQTNSFGVGGYDVFIAKYTSDGTLSWNKTWGGADDDYANSIIQTSDDGFVITGGAGSYGAGNGDAFIAKYTSNGTLSWDKTWGGAGYDDAYSVTQALDGGFVISGETGSYGAGNSDAFIAKYTSNGTLSWDKTWGGADDDYANSIIQTSDDGFLVTGTTYNYGAGGIDVFIAKYTSDGSLSWDKTWGGANYEWANSIIQTSDDGFAIAGYAHNYGTGIYDAFIAKFTSDGTLSWDKIWGGVDDDFAWAIIQTSDDGFAIAGSTNSFGAGNGDAFIAKYTSDGTLSWDKTWGGANDDTPISIIQTSDDSYVMAGYTSSYGAGSTDAFMTKYDSSGNIDGCPGSMCMDPAASTSSPSATVTNPTASVSDPTASVSDPSATVSSPSATTTVIVP